MSETASPTQPDPAPAKHPDLIFDLGMHRGEDTQFYLAKGFRVIAFEADPDLVNQCRERFAAELTTGQLRIVAGAIVADPDAASVTFYKNPVVTVWGTTDPAWQARNARMGWESEEITVPAVNFTRCLREFGVPYFIKIDIEGADLLCLRSLAKCAERPDYVSIESSKTALTAIAEELDILEQLGYTAFKAVQQATIPGTRAPRPAREGADINYVMEYDASGLFGRDLPGPWLDRADIERQYRRIFWGYRVFGNDTFMRTNRYARKLWRVLQRITRRPIPGWYDTHARHGSVAEQDGLN